MVQCTRVSDLKKDEGRETEGYKTREGKLKDTEVGRLKYTEGKKEEVDLSEGERRGDRL